MEIKPDSFFITYTDGITDDKVNNLINVISNVLEREHPSQLYFLFSSGGGFINAGLALYNFLRAIPTEVIFHNIGSVDSVATCVFLAGERRYACTTSHFLFHGVTWSFGSGTWCNRKQLQEVVSTIQNNEKDVVDIVLKRTSIGEAEIMALLDQGESKGIDFALEKGIIHEVCDAVIPPGSKHIACNFG